MTVQFSEQEEQAFKEASTNYFPDGEYVGILTEAEVKLTGEARNKNLILKYKIDMPQEYADKIYFHFLALDNVRAYRFVKMVLDQFGLDIDGLQLREIEPAMKKLCGGNVVVNFNLETKNYENKRGYQNCSIISVDSDESFADMFRDDINL